MLWALGSLRLYRDRAVASFESVFTFMIGTVVMLSLVAPFLVEGHLPSSEVIARVGPWLLLFVITLNLPTNFMILWGAARLSPGRAGILLMTEVVVGVASAAALSGEPFGPREALGACLITAAGVVELRGKA
jgi:drug/metabolite transporter (DMT)-like permease